MLGCREIKRPSLFHSLPFRPPSPPPPTSDEDRRGQGQADTLRRHKREVRRRQAKFPCLSLSLLPPSPLSCMRPPPLSFFLSFLPSLYVRPKVRETGGGEGGGGGGGGGGGLQEIPLPPPSPPRSLPSLPFPEEGFICRPNREEEVATA